MIKIKQYIKNNKHLLLIYAIMALFLIIYNKAYCMPGFFLPVITYFSGIGPEFWVNKGIDSLIFYSPIIFNKTIEYAPTINSYTGALFWCSIGCVGLLYTGEVVYNRNYLINKYLESTPIVGHALKGYKYLFVKEQSNPQYVHVVKDLVNYIGLLPKPRVEIREVEKIVKETVEKPVISYKDRQQLHFLHGKLDQIEHSVLFINDNSNFSNMFMGEITNLINLSNQLIREDCEFVTKNQDLPNILSNIKKINLQYADVSTPQRTTIGTLIRTVRDPMGMVYGVYDQPRFEIRLFAEYLEHASVELNIEFFKSNYPKIYLLLKDKMLALRGPNAHSEMAVSLNVGYKNVGRGIFGGQKIDPAVSSVEYLENGAQIIKPILPELEEFFDISMRAEKETLQRLTAEVRGFILDNTNSVIDVYLERRLQTDVLVNKSKDLMELELYIKAKRECPMSYRVPAASVIQESVVQPIPIENIDVINPVSVIVQNPLMMFAAALSIFVVNDFHNIELAAQTLLGFTHVPGWDNTFLELSRMSLSDLQTTYNLTQPGAEKAREIIDYAYDLRYPESSISASSYNNTEQISWGKIAYVGGTLLISAGVICLGYLYYQSIKNGTPVQEVAPITSNLSPSVKDWSTHVFNEIDKL